MTVDLNLDLGELPDESEEFYSLATVVNVACGGHAGDAASMRRAIDLAKDAGVRVVAHPSYADREGFGRRARFSDPATTRDVVEAQLARLRAIADEAGVAVLGVKPHGALYHDVSNDLELAVAVLDASRAALPGLVSVVGTANTTFEELARSRGYAFEREGFADRRYDALLTLVPRTRPDALLEDAPSCVAQALMLARVGKFDTLCMHGDSPNALEHVRAVRAALERSGLLRGAPSEPAK